MGNPTASRRGERGFTLIEVMIAAFVLVVGVLSTFTLIDSANTTTSLNGARVGAMGLSREIVEYARGTDYDKLTPALIKNALRQRPSLAGTSSDPWVIRRRGVNYTVTPSVCTFDDPKDGLATTPPANACPAAAALNATVDANPDDFRRVTLRIDWKIRGHAASLTQSALTVNPAGALGPRLLTVWDPSADGVPAEVTGASQVDWSGTHAVTSTTAAGVHWSADDRISQGDATGGPTSWNFTWPLGTPKLTPLTLDGTWVPDGTYQVQVQAVDGRGVPGEARTVTVYVNRHAPAALSGVQGGYNARFGGVVDMHWQKYAERDAVGYQVYRDSVASGNLVCPSSGATYTTNLTCTDANPGSPGSTHQYILRAMDCQSLATATCTARGGTNTILPVTLSAGLAPLPPLGLTASIVDGLPKLTWTPVPGAIFYRIYRDTGTNLGDRYDETISSDATYTDPHPGDTTAHTYWITAVNSSFNESSPSLPISSPGP
jgi:prepilin-type N-terminal cleavage/methylation domain-containing protein